ncbi:MAG TPA: diacylglycerol kinase family protein [Syntrophomonadaceae bacterium]|nr:diacylglycerol kinase family protein [Syntrophomonadaceae bacterium]
MEERRFKESFQDAWAGIRYSIRTQRNMKIHLAAAVLVLLVSYVLGLSRMEFALVLFAITLVLVAEMFNTAVEKTVDLYIKTYHSGARLAKHIAAGAVLVTAINAVIIGLIVFLPYLRKLL